MRKKNYLWCPMIPNVPALSALVMWNPLTLSNTSSWHDIDHRLPENLLRLLLEETRRPVPAVLVMSCRALWPFMTWPMSVTLTGLPPVRRSASSHPLLRTCTSLSSVTPCHPEPAHLSQTWSRNVYFLLSGYFCAIVEIIQTVFEKRSLHYNMHATHIQSLFFENNLPWPVPA